MRYGMNLLLWTDTLHEGILPVLDELREIGYDAVEIPIFEADVKKYRPGASTSTTPAWRAAASPSAAPTTIRSAPTRPSAAKGSTPTRRCWTAAAAAGCEVLAGPYHSALGCFSGKGPTEDEWRWGVESMRQVAEHAEPADVTWAWSISTASSATCFNTAADGARFCRDVDHPRCGMMYDTFHAHIEEKSIPAAIRALKELPGPRPHFRERPQHARGRQRPLAENFDTLHEIGYDNLMVVEAFGLALDKIVRRHQDLAADVPERAATGHATRLKFMKRQVRKRWKR